MGKAAVGILVGLLACAHVVGWGDDDEQTTPDGSGGKGSGGKAPNTGGKAPGSGGVGGSGGVSPATGGTAGSGGDGPETGTTDGNDCSLCTSQLSEARSLECYCAAHTCTQTLAEALENPKWALAVSGCGMVYVKTNQGPPPTEYIDVYDARTGRLIGASEWGDQADVCLNPNHDRGSMHAGGVVIDPFEGRECETGWTSCWLRPTDDGGVDDVSDASADGATPVSHPPCDKDALLHPPDAG